jgi:hypothetical protein
MAMFQHGHVRLGITKFATVPGHGYVVDGDRGERLLVQFLMMPEKLQVAVQRVY